MNLKLFSFNQKNSSKKLELFLNSRKSVQQNKSAIVKIIINKVKKEGDKAVLNFEKKFSNTKIKSKKIKFSKSEIKQILKKVDKNLKDSIDLAFNRIKKFHLKQKLIPIKYKDKYNNELSYKF